MALAALAVLWLATRPYVGIVHDAQYYAAQAMAWAEPARFAADLFFAAGSQDRFTVFSSLYGPLVDAIGLEAAHGLTLALGQALWLVGAWALAAALVRDRRLRLLALVGVILLPGTYGHLAILRYGEPFATPRLFVEAATLAALGLALRGRLLAPVLLLTGAALLHPLTAAPGFVVLALLRLLPRPRVAGALVAAGAAVALLLPLLPGEAGPLLRMDDEWRGIVASVAPMPLPGEWASFTLATIALQALLAAIILLRLRGRARRLVLAALLAAALGLLLAVMGGEVARLHVVLSGQPWRALWILACMANLLLPLALRPVLAHGTPEARASAALLLVTLALTPAIPGMVLATPACAALTLCHVVLRRRGAAPARPLRLVLLAALGVTAGWSVAVLAIAGAVVLAAAPGAPWLAPRAILLAAAALVLLLAVLRGVRARMTGPVALLLLGLAAVTHDQRTPWQRFVETPDADRAALEAFLPPGVVFWDGGLDMLWLRLRRPSHFACVQGGGVLFFRGTAMAFRDRADSLAFQQREGTCHTSLVPAEAPPSRAALAGACRREPTLDHIVVGTRAADVAPAASWTLPVGRDRPNMIGEPFPAGEVHRYDCAALR